MPRAQKKRPEGAEQPHRKIFISRQTVWWLFCDAVSVYRMRQTSAVSAVNFSRQLGIAHTHTALFHHEYAVCLRDLKTQAYYFSRAYS